MPQQEQLHCAAVTEFHAYSPVYTKLNCHSKRSEPLCYMVMDYLSGVVSLNISVKLAKVIDQWSHAGGQVYDTVYQFSQWHLPYWRIIR